MRLAHGYEIAVIVKLFAVLLLQVPVDGIDGVGRAVAVVLAFLVTEDFLAGKHKRRALRREHDGLRQAGYTHAY